MTISQLELKSSRKKILWHSTPNGEGLGVEYRIDFDHLFKRFYRLPNGNK